MAPVPPTLQVEESEASQLAVEEGLPAEAPAAAEPASATEVRQVVALTSRCSKSWLACAMLAEKSKAPCLKEHMHYCRSRLHLPAQHLRMRAPLRLAFCGWRRM